MINVAPETDEEMGCSIYDAGTTRKKIKSYLSLNSHTRTRTKWDRGGMPKDQRFKGRRAKEVNTQLTGGGEQRLFGTGQDARPGKRSRGMMHVSLMTWWAGQAVGNGH